MDWDRLQTNIAWRWLNCCDVNVVMNMLISLWLFWFEYQLVKQFQLARYATRLVAPCSMSFFGDPTKDATSLVILHCEMFLLKLDVPACLVNLDIWVKNGCVPTDVFAGLKGIKKPPSKERRKQQMPKTQVTYANIVTELLSKNWIFLAFLRLVTFWEVCAERIRSKSLEDMTEQQLLEEDPEAMIFGAVQWDRAKRIDFFKCEIMSWCSQKMRTSDFFPRPTKTYENNWRIRKLAVIPTKVSETFRPKNHFSL